MKLYKPKQEFVDHSFLFVLYFPFVLNSLGKKQSYIYVARIEKIHDKMINEHLKTWLDSAQ